MEFIYTDQNRYDIGVLRNYEMDLSFGKEENDFELKVKINDYQKLWFDSIVYSEGTEYGGVIDTVEASTESSLATYRGRSFHGVLNSKILAPTGTNDYVEVSGDLHEVLQLLLERCSLTDLFEAETSASAIVSKRFRFERYCKLYDGLRKLTSENRAKLLMRWNDQTKRVKLWCEPIADYNSTLLDGDDTPISVVQSQNKVNHLICLGKGELHERQVHHWYTNAFGKITTTPYYKGMDEIAEVYDYPSAESLDDLKESGKKKLEELLADYDSSEIKISSNQDRNYDIGDLLKATEQKTGIEATAAVVQKIVKIKNGESVVEYKTEVN